MKQYSLDSKLLKTVLLIAADLNEFASSRLPVIIKPILEIRAGIPTVV